MSLFALDTHKRRIAATVAHKQHDYHCYECKGAVRIREGGKQRRSHFFHLRSASSCRQSGKSEEHLFTQEWLLDQLGNTSEMEVAFPQIQRIADVVWRKEKMIFEVQCSPISAWEVAQRTLGYYSIGWRVVWLLDARTFRGSTRVEEWLASWPFAYFEWNGNSVDFFRNDKQKKFIINEIYEKTNPLLQKQCFWEHAISLIYRGYTTFLAILLNE